jgi:hypothetical protein
MFNYSLKWGGLENAQCFSDGQTLNRATIADTTRKLRCVYTIGQSREITCRDDLPGWPAGIKLPGLFWKVFTLVLGQPAGIKIYNFNKLLTFPGSKYLQIEYHTRCTKSAARCLRYHTGQGVHKVLEQFVFRVLGSTKKLYCQIKAVILKFMGICGKSQFD